MYKDGSIVDLEYIQMLYANERYDDLFETMDRLINLEAREEYKNYDYMHYVIAALVKTCNYRNALKHSRRFIKKYPEDYRTYMDSASVCIQFIREERTENSKSYKAWCSRALEKSLKAYSLNQNDVKLYNTIAEIYQMLANPEIALEWLDKAIQKDSTYSYAYFHKTTILREMHRWDDAIQVYEALLKRMPWESDVCYFQMGDTMFDAGNIDAALGFYQKSLEIDSNDCYCVDKIADCYELLGDSEKVIETYQNALNYDVSKGYIKWRLAEYLYYKKRIEEALSIYTEITNSNKYDIWNAILSCKSAALIYLNKKDFKNALHYSEKGLKYLTQALQEYPDYIKDNSDTAINLNMVFADCKFFQENFTESIAAYNKALEYFEFYKLAANQELAENALKTSISPVYTRLAVIYLCLNDLEKVAEYLNRNPEYQSSEGCYFLVKAELAYRLGNLDEAKILYKKSVEMNDNVFDEQDKKILTILNM